MAFRVRAKHGVNIKKVVIKIFATVLVLYVGGQLLTQLGNSMLCTSSPFYPGLSLIGWQVSNSVYVNSTTAIGNTYPVCNVTTPLNNLQSGTLNNLITSTNGSGILTVIGLVGIASVVMEFVEISF